MSDWQYIDNHYLNNLYINRQPVRHSDYLESPEDKAKALFLRHCSLEQQQEFRKYEGITVKGKLGGIYFIACRDGYLSNIICMGGTRTYNIFGWKFIRKKRITKRYCMHLQYAFEYPKFDHFLAQKITIETDERRFLWIAL